MFIVYSFSNFNLLQLINIKLANIMQILSIFSEATVLILELQRLIADHVDEMIVNPNDEMHAQSLSPQLYQKPIL